MSTPKGFTRSRRGFRAYVKVNGVPRFKRFPATATPKEIKAWREETRVALRALAPEKMIAGSLKADIARYLAQVAAMPTIAQRTEHLELWADALGPHVPRSSITAEQIRAVLNQWRIDGLSAATCNKRRTALMHLWSTLDGKSGRNPVRDVTKFRVADPLPRGRNFSELRTALEAMPDTRTKARLLVMFWCGMRPVEVMRAEPDDVNAHERYVIARTAKGGRTRTIPLTPAAVKAWQLFDDLDAWGTFTVAPLGRMLKKATGLNIRPYDLRHSYGTALARQGARLDAIAALMGHSSLELTKRYTLAAVGPEAVEATARLGRSAKAPRKRSKRRRAA